MFRRTVLLAVLAVLAGTGEALAQKPTRKDALQERVRQFYRRARVERAAVAALVVVAESEPNNAAASADAVTLGDQATGEVNPAGDADYFVFSVTAGTILDIDVDASDFGSPLNANLRLFDTDGVTSLAFNDDRAFSLDSRLRFTIDVTGDYFIAIRGFSGGGGPGFSYKINFNTLTPGPGDPTTLFASGFQGPWGMAYDGGGNLFVAEAFEDLVSRVTPAGAVSVFATGIPGPRSLAFDGFGDLLVTADVGIVYKVSSTGVPTAFLTDLLFPTAITTGPDGSIWVADNSTALRRYDAFGVFQESINITTVGFVFSLAFSPAGELYLSNFFDSIFKLVAGVPQLFIRAPTIIEALAFDVDGFLYVSNGAVGKVVLYAPDGSVVNDEFAVTNLSGPINLAFGRNTDGTTNARLFADNPSLGPPLILPFNGGIVEINPLGIRAPGWPVSVELTNFAIAVSPNSNTVTQGSAPTYTVTISPFGGSFDDAVSLACSGLPSLASCSFAPASVTPGASDATSTMTVTTTAPSASAAPSFGQTGANPVYPRWSGWLWLGLAGLALVTVVLGGLASRKRRLGLQLAFAVVLLVVPLSVACGGDGDGVTAPPGGTGGTPTGTFTITITGTSGSFERSTTATLIVQ